jgi:hypothetical protein
MTALLKPNCAGASWGIATTSGVMNRTPALRNRSVTAWMSLVTSVVCHIVMALTVLDCFVLRMIVRENDPKSLLAVLYVQSFRFLNLFVRWDKLPTFLAVTNLGALREVLRAKNLHNTSDIPVTELKGLRVASSRVQSRPSFQCRRRPSSNWPSTSRPPAHSA